MARKQNVTFADIAKYTNFSKTTISRYFNNPDSLTEKNQKIIADALEKLNYQENKVARILASGQTEFVGVIIPNLFLHYYSEMLDRILSTYETFGYKFLVFLSNGDADTERQYIQELLSYKIEGLIILSHAIPSMELANLHIPIVAIERRMLTSAASTPITTWVRSRRPVCSIVTTVKCFSTSTIRPPKVSRHTVESKGLKIFAGNNRFPTASFSMR